MRLPGTRYGNAVTLESALQSAAACGKVLGSLRTTMTRERVFLQFKLMALCHSQVSLMLRTAINITEATHSCQFQYVFGNQ